MRLVMAVQVPQGEVLDGVGSSLRSGYEVVSLEFLAVEEALATLLAEVVLPPGERLFARREVPHFLGVPSPPVLLQGRVIGRGPPSHQDMALDREPGELEQALTGLP